MCLYTGIFSIGPTNGMGPQFEKSPTLEKKIIRKHSFKICFSVLTEDFLGCQPPGHTQNEKVIPFERCKVGS